MFTGIPVTLPESVVTFTGIRKDGITIRGELARTIKEKAKAANKEPAELLREWINKRSSMEDLGDLKAADISEKNSKGKPNISGDDLFKQCGI